MCLIFYTAKIHGLLIWKHAPANVTARKLLLNMKPEFHMQVHISRKKEMEIRNVFSTVKLSISSGNYWDKLRREGLKDLSVKEAISKQKGRSPTKNRQFYNLSNECNN